MKTQYKESASARSHAIVEHVHMVQAHFIAVQDYLLWLKLYIQAAKAE